METKFETYARNPWRIFQSICVWAVLTVEMLQGKKVLVTGASSGLGETVALECAKENVELLVITGRDSEKLQAVEKKIEGAKVRSVVCDMSKPDDIDKLVLTVEKIVGGKLDVLLANHGIAGTSFRPVSEFTEVEFENFENVMNVNFTSMVRLTNGLARLMSENGSIVYVTSVNAQLPSKGGAAYCCSKSALTMFMKCAALDLAQRHIRVNCVAPGFIDTPFQNQFFGSPEEQTPKLAEIGRSMPLGRIPSKQGISNAILFLASDLAMDITGTEQVVDCGGLLKRGNA